MWTALTNEGINWQSVNAMTASGINWTILMHCPVPASIGMMLLSFLRLASTDGCGIDGVIRDQLADMHPSL